LIQKYFDTHRAARLLGFKTAFAGKNDYTIFGRGIEKKAKKCNARVGITGH